MDGQTATSSKNNVLETFQNVSVVSVVVVILFKIYYQEYTNASLGCYDLYT